MLRLNAFSLRDGTRLCGLPFSDCSWSQSWNESGSMSVTIPLSDDIASLDLDTILVEQQTALSFLFGFSLFMDCVFFFLYCSFLYFYSKCLLTLCA